MNENELYLVKEYEIDNSPIQKIDSLIDISTRDCHHKYFHTFDIYVNIILFLQRLVIMKQLILQLLIKT